MEFPGTLVLSPHTFSDVSEQLESSKLTLAQRKNVENILFSCIQEKLGLAVDATVPLVDLALKSEFLRGQITILQYMLALADNAVSSTSHD